MGYTGNFGEATSLGTTCLAVYTYYACGANLAWVAYFGLFFARRYSWYAFELYVPLGICSAFGFGFGLGFGFISGFGQYQWPNV